MNNVWIIIVTNLPLTWFCCRENMLKVLAFLIFLHFWMICDIWSTSGGRHASSVVPTRYYKCACIHGSICFPPLMAQPFCIYDMYNQFVNFTAVFNSLYWYHVSHSIGHNYFGFILAPRIRFLMSIASINSCYSFWKL